jgi:hypothetical protein
VIIHFVRPLYFNTQFLSSGDLFNTWFDSIKRLDIEIRRRNKIYDLHDRYKQIRQTLCVEFIKTAEERSKLLALILSEEGKTDFVEEYEYL